MRPLARRHAPTWHSHCSESPSQRQQTGHAKDLADGDKRPPSLDATGAGPPKEKTREVDVLHRITDSISNTLDLEAVLKHIVEIVVEVTKADACLLYLLSDGAGRTDLAGLEKSTSQTHRADHHRYG